jgi:pilus assembly protein CpaB
MTEFKDLKTETKLLILAAGCGLIAAALTYILITGKEKNIMAAMEPVRVVAAAKFIPAWTKLDDTMVNYIEIPAKFVTKAHMVKFEKYKGQMSMAPFIEGEPLLSNKLTGKGEELNVAIPTGLRAVSVAVDEEAGVGYMIKPGDYVDVILTYRDEAAGGNGKNMVTATVLQDVRIVAVGQDFSFTRKNVSYGSVTLALTPAEAEVLIFAREKGKISFTLRALGDHVKEKIRTTEFEGLIKQIKKNETGSETAKAAVNEPAKNVELGDENTGGAVIKKRGE